MIKNKPRNAFMCLPRDPIDKCPKDCVYRGALGNFRTCDYILIHGEKRGCKGGKHCEKYRKGEKTERGTWDERKRKGY